MSELISIRDNRATIRWKLLTTASAIALTGYISSTGVAKAEDGDRPTLWIELGGQMEMMQGTSTPFKAPFMFLSPVPDVYGDRTFTQKQRPPRFTFGAEGKITFQPEDSDWTVSAGVRYGRSHGKRHAHYQTNGQPTQIGIYYSGVLVPLTQYYPPGTENAVEAFSDTRALFSEHHLVLDFSVGHDVGIGLLGHDGTSNVNLGVRAVEFTQDSSISIYARPKVDLINIKYPLYFVKPNWDQHTLAGHTQRSFKGLGPSLSWNASAGLVGNTQDGELMLDWGINAALLFGRQKAKTDHSTQASHYNNTKYNMGYAPIYAPRVADNPLRSRRVTVPNLGGFAGLSLKWANAKISVGYRGDIFFKAMDRGIDVRQDSNLTFNGPYASISIGVGD